MFDEDSYEIERYVNRFDEIMVFYEAKWGIGVLPELATDEMRQKWDKHIAKLNDAIQRKDLKKLAVLVDGAVKGLEAIEKEVEGRGIEPEEPECMDVKLESGFHLRIAKNHTQARSVTEEGVYVWSLQEVARVIEKDYTLVNKVKDVFPEAKVVVVKNEGQDDFDWENGDSVEF